MNSALGQYMTPDWAAQELVDRYFGDLCGDDRAVEPSCGRGAFLAAIPGYVPAVGVEIDPGLADVARRRTGREVRVGDFCATALPFEPTVLIGNPPFQLRTIERFLDRAWELLPDEGRVGFILPCYTLQTPRTVERLAERWSIQQDLLPRTLFRRLSHPLCFAVLRKGPKRGLVGFALYHEAAAVERLGARYRALLAEGERSVWAAVVRAALAQLGGRASLAQLYNEIADCRPTSNRFWQAKVRQVLQRTARRCARGVWELPPTQGVLSLLERAA